MVKCVLLSVYVSAIRRWPTRWHPLGQVLRPWWMYSRKCSAPILVPTSSDRTSLKICSSELSSRSPSVVTLHTTMVREIWLAIHWRYHLQRTIPIAMANLRNAHGICPSDVHKFILDLFKYSDNSRNKVRQLLPLSPTASPLHSRQNKDCCGLCVLHMDCKRNRPRAAAHHPCVIVIQLCQIRALRLFIGSYPPYVSVKVQF